MRTLVCSATLAVCISALAAPLATAAATSRVASPDEIASETPIKHLVVVFQENASFDHYFGTYPIAANPTGDPTFVARPDTPPVNNLLPSTLNGNRDLLADNPNQSKPFRLDRTQFVTCSQDHTYRPEQRAANGGLMNRFVQATNTEGRRCVDRLPRPVPSPQVMGFFDGNTVTALWNYAQHFGLNDNSFATNYGPSTPGALNLVAGRTSGASPDNSSTVTGGVLYADADPMFDICSDAGKTQAKLTGPNVGDLLTGAGIPWGWFQGGFRLDPDKDPAEECESGSPNLAGIEETDYEAHHNPFQYFLSTSNKMHLPPSSDAAIGLDDQANHLYDLEDFWSAAEHGNLPAVSFLKAAGYQDGHPGPQNSNPLNEQDFLVDTLNRLQRSPEWSSTAVILAWDDSDGEYDHQFPPNVHHSRNLDLDGLYGTSATTLCLAASGQPAPDPQTVFEMRCGYGERLPFLVISPYALDNHVDHTLTDQTSVLRFIEDNWGLGRLGNASFDDEAGLLMTMFDFAHPRTDRLFLNPFTGNPNRTPTIDSLRVTPDRPVIGDVLTVSAVASDPDHDPTNPGRQDKVDLSYEWFNGATRLPETERSLDLSVPGNGDPGDTITVRVTADDGFDATSDSATVKVDTAPTVGLGDDSASVQYSDDVSPIWITATDPDGDGLTVETVGLPDGLGVSQATDNIWVISGNERDMSGVYDVLVRASDGRLTSELPLRIVVNRELARVGYTGYLLFSTGSAASPTAPVSLLAHVTQQEDDMPGDLPRARVLFDLYAPGNSTGSPDATHSASPDVAGDAIVDVGPLGTGTWTVVVRTDPSGDYFEAPASDVVPMTVYAPTSGTFVTGGGWVHDGAGRGDFGFDARHRMNGTLFGNVTYVFTGTDGHQLVVRSTGWRGGGLAISENRATVAGTCDVTVLDQNGDVVFAATGNRFRLDVTDAARSDTFALSVYSPDGALYHRVGTPRDPAGLGGGQVVVHH
jgi:phospholipase C